MSGSNDYINRLKSIREKYGCSQSRPSSAVKVNTEPQVEKPHLSAYTLIETDKLKMLESLLPSGRQQGGARPINSIAESAKRVDRETDIMRLNYAENRQQYTEQTPVTSAYPPINPIHALAPVSVPPSYNPPLTYAPVSYAPCPTCQTCQPYKEQCRDKRVPNIESIHQDYREQQAKSRDWQDHQSRNWPEYEAPRGMVSPIRAIELDDRRGGHRNDEPWRQSDQVLSELRTNRKVESPFLQKSSLYPSAYSNPYCQPQGLVSKSGNENRGEQYSIANIDRIQHKIQSVLGSR